MKERKSTDREPGGEIKELRFLRWFENLKMKKYSRLRFAFYFPAASPCVFGKSKIVPKYGINEYDYNAMPRTSMKHLFGTDEFGQDHIFHKSC